MNSRVDQSANDDDVYDDDAETSEKVAAKTKPAKKAGDSKRRATLLLTIIAVAAAIFGAYELRRAEQLATQVASLTSQNATMHNQMATMEQNLQSIADKLSEMSKEKMPVVVVFRPGARGGLSAFFKNNSPEAITVSVLLTNPLTSRRRESNMTIPANGVSEIGDMEGWVFAPGHHVMVTHAEFGSVEYVVPGP
jgi:cell division protein FtsB